MKKGFFPGTFNPPTLGHWDIIQRAKSLCDILYVGISHNQQKFFSLFSEEERKALLTTLTKGIDGIIIDIFSGLTVDYIQKQGIHFLIRGLRSSPDCDFEFTRAIANRQMCGVETIFLLSDPRFAHISSSLVREIGSYGHSLSGFVPEMIEPIILKKIKSQHS